jgi:CheY-like chemotaxis protein
VKPVGREELLTALGRVTSIPAVQEAPPKVLAIDDDPMAVNLIEAVLEPKGYTVLKAGSGEEGIALARQEQPVIILLDLLMPEVDGFEVVERLRAEPGTARIPIVILTSQTMTRAEKERLNGQISFLAQKAEFKRADLLELVRNFAQTQNT